jgi:adenylate cyclase class 2
VASRRLIDDRLYDNSNHQLQSARSTLRIRRDGSRGILTFKGPVQPGPVKTREEIETGVGDVEAMTGIVTALGYAPFFRAQKYREGKTFSR